MPNLINLPPSPKTVTSMSLLKRPAAAGRSSITTQSSRLSPLSKSLLTGLTYPHDWGFVPSTKADDGDPIDIMLMHDAATFPGIVLACRVIGILQIEQKSKGKTERNDRLFAVPKRFAFGAGPERCARSIRAHSARARKVLQGDRRA